MGSYQINPFPAWDLLCAGVQCTDDTSSITISTTSANTDSITISATSFNTGSNTSSTYTNLTCTSNPNKASSLAPPPGGHWSGFHIFRKFDQITIVKLCRFYHSLSCGETDHSFIFTLDIKEVFKPCPYFRAFLL